MHAYSVGQAYNPKIASWPESAEYNFRAGQHELLLFFNRPNEEEIASVKSGLAHFAFAAEAGAIILLYRFEPAIPWGDAAFTIHLLPEAERQLPGELATPETRAILNTVLIDASDGIIRAMRTVTLSPDFTRKLHRAITDQAAAEWPGEAAYRGQIEAVYQRLATAQLLKRAIAQTKGGA